MSITEAYREKVASGEMTEDPAQLEVLPEFERIARELSAPPRRRGLFRRAEPVAARGLYIWGDVGRGKSMLMDLFHAHAGDIPRRRVHFHAFMQEVQDGLTAARKTGVDDAILPVADAIADDVRLLCFDEMQITDIADAMIVGRLFQRLFDRGVTVVTTSNRPPQDLYKDGLNRKLFLPFIDLLTERMVVHELAADRDYRQDRLAGRASYFVPADAEARAAMEAVWQDLAGGPGEAMVLRVKGREVELPQASNGVARVGFWDLCGRPLGPADYLAVAQAVRVLLLENVPLLSSDNYNEARRFVTLIDALYEARVRLFVSAAAEPENLYIEGEGLFEFARTASRLREMQSEGWGG
jgi:cell division protein ZapE